MEYVDLYNLAQEIIDKREDAKKSSAIVPVVELKSALVQRVGWISDINFHGIETKPGDPLGHYECHSDAESRWEEPNAWVVLITYDEKRQIEERRFIWCKELMHIFDTEDGCVKTPQEYRGLLTEIELKPIDPSPQFLTEIEAKWKELLILCPKKQRDEMKKRVQDKELTDYDVAVHFRIPEAIVVSLFSNYYDSYYERFITNK